VRSTWPALVSVVAVGTVIGISIGGLPASRANEVDLSTTTTTAFVPPADAPPLVATTIAVPTTEPPATEPPATEPPSTEPPAPETTVADTTAPTTEAPPVTDGVPVLLDRAEVRVVVANGDGRFNLVGVNVDRLLPLGYVTIDQTDVSESRRVDRTVVYYRDGFDDEALRLAADMLVPAALLEPLGDRTVTNDDANGDLIAVLGPDAVR